MPLDVSKPITRREFVIDYIAPLVCHEIASASGDVVISILPFDELLYPTGLLLEGTGPFNLSWNAVKRAICYNVYRSLSPTGPFQLVSVCQSTRTFSDDPGTGTWYYIVNAVTPDGVTPFTPPIAGTDDGNGGGGNGGSCPEESGTDTHVNLITPEDTDLGSITPDPFIPTHTDDFGSFGIGQYKIIYTGGAYKEDDNPNPGDWKFNGYTWLWNNGISSFDPDPSGFFGASQAAVEALVPLGLEQEFFHTTAGAISVSFGRFGSATNPVAGSPNPTFQLKRTGSFPNFPLQVRIQDYSPSIWVGSCNGQGSADPEWNGEFTDRLLALPSLADWAIASAATINGMAINSADVYSIGDHPTSGSGWGWRLDIIFFDGMNFVVGWTGIKGIDDVPQGRYYRDGGCFTGPECLVVEEF